MKENIPLAPYAMYKIGGPARFFIEVSTSSELEGALHIAKINHLPFFILGAGSNVLISDKGFDGLVIHMKGGALHVDGCLLTVDSGVMMAQAVHASAKAGLMGFEWGIGIPGTVGGSVRGNAGCFGGEMKDVIESVEIFDAPNAQRATRTVRDCEFAYRDSIFKRHPGWVILSVTLRLMEGNPKDIQEKIQTITRERMEKQDIGTKSCGCIFKNVPWDRSGIDRHTLLERFPELDAFKDVPTIPASFLIDRVGLKGERVGRVSISPTHANFFVNEGGASAEEVVTLIVAAKELVQRKFSIVLEEEIQYVGFSTLTSKTY